MGIFSEADEREDEYWAAVKKNAKLREALKNGYLTKKGYRMLRDPAEDYHDELLGNIEPPRRYSDWGDDEDDEDEEPRRHWKD